VSIVCGNSFTHNTPYDTRNNTRQVTLRPEDVIVCETRIDQGMAGANPMAGVRFYQVRFKQTELTQWQSGTVAVAAQGE
jgi:hypothetical protein